jgi:hypothetical protein
MGTAAVEGHAVTKLVTLLGLLAGLFAGHWSLVIGHWLFHSSDLELESSRTATLVLVRGAPGSDEFGTQFRAWCERWKSAAAGGGASVVEVGADESATDDRELLRQALADAAAVPDRPLWIVLIGHGTCDGREAKFNLRGPDVSAQELRDWLVNCPRPVAVVNCASASAPFIADLSAPGRVVVAATKSGAEVNFARFGDYLSQAIGDLSADLDKDGQVSLLEAFLRAARQTQEFYDGEGRLATEHALVDDDGNGLGTRSEAFEGVRPVREAESGSIDGYRAHQWHLVPSESERAFPAELKPQRDDLELAVIKLRDRKSEVTEAAYYAELERLLVQLAELYERAAGEAERVSPSF